MAIKERLTMEKLTVEKIKVETQEKIDIMNETSNDNKMKSKINLIRLPRLELRKFDGNILKWQEFWDIFDMICKNVDECHYPRSQLRGQASEMLIGIEMTNDNYMITK